MGMRRLRISPAVSNLDAHSLLPFALTRPTVGATLASFSPRRINVSQLPVSLNPGETVLREDDQAIHVKNNPIGIGYNVIYGTLWLTSQRIVFSSFPLGNVLTYPLRRITGATRAEISVSHRTVSSPLYTRRTFFDAGLKLDFDNSGREYLIPREIDDWVQAIRAAQLAAPDLPYVQVPPLTSAVEQGSRVGVLVGIFFAVVLCFLCGVGGVLGVIFLLASRAPG
jgi:hypothetical protein